MTAYVGTSRTSRVSVRNQGVGTWIETRAKTAPDHPALVYGDISRTYADLAARVRRLAHALRSLGVERGDRVAWLGTNHPAFLELFFAAAKIGAVLAPINYRLERSAVDTVVRDSAPRVAIVDTTVSDVTSLSEVSRVVRVAPANAQDSQYEQLIAGYPDKPIDERVTFDDLLLLAFTSGTTGAPKGIMLSHGNVTWNVVNVLTSIDVHAGDVTIALAPFFRTGGIGVNVLPVLFQGGTVVIPRSADPDEILRQMEQHRVTLGFGSPDLVEVLTRSPKSYSADFSQLRFFMTGGARLRERLARTSHERGFNVLEGYGLSEAGPFVSVLDAVNAPRKPGSVGRPGRFVDVRIVRPDGAAAVAGEVGELRVRGPNVMSGYWKRPDATQRALDEDGWLRTGDVAYLDADGFLFIVGRAADAYMSDGTLVHPGFAERVLLEHPSVAEAVVVAGDEGAIAYVVLEPWAEAGVESELWSLSRQHLCVHARPAAIQRVASLPKNPAGKVMRHVIRSEQVDRAW